jgi:AbrB family looped-hinge helix DNA binding protein
MGARAASCSGVGPDPAGRARKLYWLGMTQRVGAKGQVVIPKRLRERQGLGPGVAVAFEERADGVLIRANAVPEPLRGRYRGTGMAAKLIEDRAAEPR